jgi:cytochrome oxidase Cu insertion factor (SCO1/SenC/PrrC family)
MLGLHWMQVNADEVQFAPMFRRGVLLALLLALQAASSGQVLPKPQVAHATGQAAPDFSLLDQNGKTFQLRSLRGQRVLLVFYRAHW